MPASRSHILSTKADVVIQLRDYLGATLAGGPTVRARNLAQRLFDDFELSEGLIEALVLDALTALARSVIQEYRARHRTGAYSSKAAEERARGTPMFPDFEAICRECPRNYALPGEPDPTDTIYVETFDFDFAQLKTGAEYLRGPALTALNHARALMNLYDLCVRLGGNPGETPREILQRHSYDPG